MNRKEYVEAINIIVKYKELSENMIGRVKTLEVEVVRLRKELGERSQNEIQKNG